MQYAIFCVILLLVVGVLSFNDAQIKPHGSVLVERTPRKDPVCRYTSGSGPTFHTHWKGDDYFTMCYNGEAYEYVCMGLDSIFDFDTLTCVVENDDDDDDDDDVDIDDDDDDDEDDADKSGVPKGAIFLGKELTSNCNSLQKSYKDAPYWYYMKLGETGDFVVCHRNGYVGDRYRCAEGSFFNWYSEECEVVPEIPADEPEDFGVPKGAIKTGTEFGGRCKVFANYHESEPYWFHNDFSDKNGFVLCTHSKPNGVAYSCPLGTQFDWTKNACVDFWQLPKGAMYLEEESLDRCEFFHSLYMSQSYWVYSPLVAHGADQFVLCRHNKPQGSKYSCPENYMFDFREERCLKTEFMQDAACEGEEENACKENSHLHLFEPYWFLRDEETDSEDTFIVCRHEIYHGLRYRCSDDNKFDWKRHKCVPIMATSSSSTEEDTTRIHINPDGKMTLKKVSSVNTRKKNGKSKSKENKKLNSNVKGSSSQRSQNSERKKKFRT